MIFPVEQPSNNAYNKAKTDEAPCTVVNNRPLAKWPFYFLPWTHFMWTPKYIANSIAKL